MGIRVASEQGDRSGGMKRVSKPLLNFSPLFCMLAIKQLLLCDSKVDLLTQGGGPGGFPWGSVVVHQNTLGNRDRQSRPESLQH